MTANAFAEERQKCLDLGMNDFITNPVELTNLYQKLQVWL